MKWKSLAIGVLGSTFASGVVGISGTDALKSMSYWFVFIPLVIFIIWLDGKFKK